MRIVIWGDSIAAGLGVKGQSYGDIIVELLQQSGRQVEMFNMAKSKFQLKDSLQFLDATIALDPDIVIVAHGTTESVVRPTEKWLNRMPRRWSHAQMDPRPYYSRSWFKHFIGRIDSGMRWRVKVFLIRHFGNTTWSTKGEFQSVVSSTIQSLLRATNAHIIFMSHYGIDERFFPYSLASMDDFSEVARNEVRKHKHRVHFCDVRDVCSRWDDYLLDHFHPNVHGHRKIAEKVIELIDQLSLLPIQK